jgi:hypothetical protein
MSFERMNKGLVTSADGRLQTAGCRLSIKIGICSGFSFQPNVKCIQTVESSQFSPTHQNLT